MFFEVTPESVGISSEKVLRFFKVLDKYNFCTHSVIMARGNKIFAEAYYAPFNKEFKHRMYSVSKSFVGVAVGFAIEDGLLSLDDKFVNFFPEYTKHNPDIGENLKNQTIRDMLTMQTSQSDWIWWFGSGTKDRSEVYFKGTSGKIPGTIFQYDSPASFMLCVIVERLTGKSMMEYLKDKCLRAIGFSEDAYCIKCPGGNSFADSGVMCTSRDLLKFARFVMNKGMWEGVRYMNEEYLTEAVKKQVSSSISVAHYGSYGYGYQIWKAPRDGFAFVGMGDQFAICDPETDFIFIITSDNQGNGDMTRAILYHELYTTIVENLEEPMEENPAAYAELKEYTDNLKLFSLKGNTKSTFASEIDGVTYKLDKNPMNIEYIRLDFDNKRGKLTYKNLQGEKELEFGLGYNEFLKFPQKDYDDMVATVPEKGHMYDCACSAEWQEEKKLHIKVQIIDKSFGNLSMIFSFKDDIVGIRMVKNAQAFLNEYQGYANGKRVN